MPAVQAMEGLRFRRTIATYSVVIIYMPSIVLYGLPCLKFLKSCRKKSSSLLSSPSTLSFFFSFPLAKEEMNIEASRRDRLFQGHRAGS